MITSPHPTQLPEFLRELLANCPGAGAGVHKWLYLCARQLHAHYQSQTIADMLEAGASNCGRHIPRREIEAAVKDSKATAWQPNGIGRPITPPSALKWPAVNCEQREAIIAKGGGLAELWEASPIRIEDDEQHAAQVIDSIFPGNPLLCCGWSSYRFDTRPREEWRGELSGLQFIVPSPMTAVTGRTKDGRESKHCLANTGPRWFLVCEFDNGTTDEHASILLHLAGQYGPLVLAVHSGGKSLHGWFYVAGQPEDTILRFFRYAVQLGADPATWTRSQFVRMPDGQRDNGKRQTVYFLNLQPLEAH